MTASSSRATDGRRSSCSAPDDLESLEETLELLHDPEAAESLRRSREDEATRRVSRLERPA